MSLLEVEGLEAGYETGQVLFDVDLAVDRNQAISLLGRNGVGKTTTMYSIMGKTPPEVYDGTISFDGEDITGTKSHRRARRGISIVPQERRIFPNFTVEENIRLFAEGATNPRVVDEAIDYFEPLQEMRDHKGRNMSGGEQQMLAIARALVANPEIILMDEPTEGLAPLIVEDLEKIIELIVADENVAILLIEQNLETALDVCSSHYIMENGAIVGQFDTETLEYDEELRTEYLGV